MKPVVVKYRLKHHLYNLDANYPLSCLVLDVCTDLDLYLDGVQFTLKCGSTLPEDCVLSDLPDFEESNLVRIFVEDIPCMEQYDEDNQCEDVVVDGIPITISLPSKAVIQKTLKPDDTVETLIGELILNKSIDLNIDVSLSKKESPKKGRDRSPLRMPDIVKEFGYGCKIIDDLEIKKGDILKIIDREATKENNKLARTDVMIHLRESNKKVRWSILSSSTSSEAIGSLLSSGDLGTKVELQLHRKNPNVADEYIPFDCGDIFGTEYSKRQSLIKLMNLEEGDKLVVVTTTCDGTNMEDYRNLEDLIEDVDVMFHGFVKGTWVTYEMVVEKADTIAMFVKRMKDKGVEEFKDIMVDGRVITDPNVPIESDTRYLIGDCGVKSRSKIVAKKPDPKTTTVVLARQFADKTEMEYKPVEMRTDAIGKDIKLKIHEEFGIIVDSIDTIYQRGQRLSKTDSFGIETVTEDGIDWLFLDYINFSHDYRDVRQEEPRRLLVRNIGDDERFMTLGTSKPVVYFRDSVIYYSCPEVPGEEFVRLLPETDPWNDENFVAFVQGVRVVDSVTNSKVRFLLYTHDNLANLLNGANVKQCNLHTSEDIDIPPNNRSVNHVIIFMRKRAFIPVVRDCWNSKSRISIWLRQNYEGKCNEVGVLSFHVDSTTPRISNDPFQWNRNFRGCAAFEDKWAIIIKS